MYDVNVLIYRKYKFQMFDPKYISFKLNIIVFSWIFSCMWSDRKFDPISLMYLNY